jgi:hypothetical protein
MRPTPGSAYGSYGETRCEAAMLMNGQDDDKDYLRCSELENMV